MRSALFCSAALSLALLVSCGRSEDKPNPYAGQFAGHVAKTDPLRPEDEQKAFHLPPGFVIQLVAADPDIHKPINMNFDDRGRLWITESVEYPFPAKNGKPRDKVKVLEDFGPDGRARKITTWADGLNIPIGLLPLPGARPQEALVYSIPNVWKLTDTEGKGHADKRVPLYGKIGFDDTHGMTSNFTMGFDGWVYACHGFRNTSTLTAADGSSVTMTSGNFYRMKVDGSHVEAYAFGQVNPFGLAWDPLGNLYSSDCETKSVWQLVREAYYPSFGRPDDGLGFGPELIHHDHGSSAIAGVVYYAADNFPKEYLDTTFVGNVVTNRINHDKLVRHGSSFQGIKQPDFLTCDDPWFRPVSLQLGPDGALYVADFYNRIIGHYEVPLDHPGRDRERGRIWRIVYTGVDGKTKATAPRLDWTTASVEELIKDLNHPNLTVRMKATNQLVERGDKATKAVAALFNRAGTEPASTALQRRHGLWVLARTNALEDRVLADATQDKEFGVRVHAQRVLAEKAKLTPEQHKLTLAGLKDADANVQRAAVEALARHPDAANLRPLLDLRHAVAADDPQLLHGVRIALRDQLRPDENWAKLPTGEDWTDRDIRAIAGVSLGVPSAPAAAYLVNHLDKLTGNRALLARFVHHAARYGTPDVTPALLKFVTAYEPKDLGRQIALFRAVNAGTAERGQALTADFRAWGVDLTARLLDSKHGDEVLAGAELAGALMLDNHQDQLTRMAVTAGTPERQRAAALNALAALGVKKHAGTLGKVLTDAHSSIGLREQSANLLARANQPEAQEQLFLALPSAPARLENVIAAGLAGSKTGAEKLLDAIKAGKASARLLQEQAVKVKLSESNLPGWKERVAKLTEGLPSADEKLATLLKNRRQSFVKNQGDSALGAKVFEKQCAICHTLGNKGAKVGPQLDGIGIRGLDRILEDVLDPNRNVDQAFRTTILNLKDGKTVTGLLLREEGEIYVMADAMGKEVRVPKNTVDEKAVSPASPMPANFADQIPEADFNHLLAYLLSQTAKPEPPAPK